MNRLKDLLAGKKTIIGVIGIGVVMLAQSLGWVDETLYQKIMAALVAFTGVSLRLAVRKAE